MMTTLIQDYTNKEFQIIQILLQIQHLIPHFGYMLAVMKCGLVHGTVSDKQISRTFQGFFKNKLQFLGTNIYLINPHSLTPFDHPIGLGV